MASRSGAQTMNSMYFKPMLRKAFHGRSGSAETMISGDTAKLNGGEEMKNKNKIPNPNNNSNSNSNNSNSKEENNWWIPDDRTGIFYPKGQEEVMADVPSSAAKQFEPIHYFSNNHHHTSF